MAITQVVGLGEPHRELVPLLRQIAICQRERNSDAFSGCAPSYRFRLRCRLGRHGAQHDCDKRLDEKDYVMSS